jgi:hypothetical protein
VLPLSAARVHEEFLKNQPLKSFKEKQLEVGLEEIQQMRF